ncbi:MAG TPA: DUF4349 domain-containing protein [Gaiellaceae bacterium]
MPATDTVDFERDFPELVARLRAVHVDAPAYVRERVRSLGEPGLERPALADRLAVVRWRQSLLVLAPICVVGLIGAALVHGLVSSGTSKQEAVATTRSGEGGSTARAPAAGAFDSAVPGPSTARAQDYQATMTLRVEDRALTSRTNEAMQVVRAAGGYVASVRQSTAAGQPGSANLVLRVPVSRVEGVLVQLSGLGTVIDRQLSIRDLEGVLRQQRARILQLRVFIARATEQLRGALPADVRLRLQLQLQQARTDLLRLTGANKATLRQASLSRVSLTLTTQKAAGVPKSDHMGRVERAARDAGSFLAGAGAVLLFLLIVLSPVIVLTLAAVWAFRAYRRREERRLLASA